MDALKRENMAAKAGTGDFTPANIDQVLNDCDLTGDVEKLLGNLRILRTACAHSSVAQAHLVQADFIVRLGEAIAAGRLRREVTPCALQVLHNCAVKQNNFLKEMLPTYRAVWLECLASEEAKVRDYAASLVLLSLNAGLPCEEVISDETYVSLFQSLTLCHEEDRGFAGLVVTALTRNQPALLTSKAHLLHGNKAQRLCLLEMIEEAVVDVKDSRVLVEFTARQFKDQSALLLTTLKHREALEPAETMLLLRILCDVGAGVARSHLQADKSVLIDCVYLLKLAHQAGKAGDDADLKPVRKLSEVGEELSSSPVFGFKSDLIRLIANLVFEHRENQDLVRELDGIALILDCSPIDGKNPLIMQWVIMAVRNLCHNNRENQDEVRHVDVKGVAVNTVAEELGIPHAALDK